MYMHTGRILLATAFLLGGVNGFSAPVRILPMGDSITHGYWAGIGTNAYNSYRKTLKNLLETNGHEVDFVGSLSDGDFADNQHEGHDGWYADHDAQTNCIIDHAESWVADTSADVVLLHIGTNDLNGDNSDTDAAEVSVILDEIFVANSNATIVLALIINAASNTALQTSISIYNSNLNVMAQIRIANGDDLLVVDMENGAEIDYNSTDMADQLHPSPAGYDKMATSWYPAVVQAVTRQRWRSNGPPHIDSVSVHEENLVLGITNLPTGLPFGIEVSSNLVSAEWSNVTIITATGPSTNCTLSTDANRAYYRIVGN